jgi:proliferating cell nuclear antigen
MEVSANKFINAVKAASIVSDRISFIVDKWEFVIKAVGEKESYQTNIHPKQISAPPGIVQSDFSMDYMKDLIKPMEGETMIRIDMGEEHPVRLLLPIEGLSTTYFLLAPRMRKEEKKGQAGGP